MTGLIRHMEICRLLSNAVEGTLQATDIPGHHMSIYLSGLDIGVTKQVLEDTYIDSAFQHMSGEAVAQRVTPHFFINSGLVRGPLHRFLQDGF